MAEQFDDTVAVRDGEVTTILLNANAATVNAGGNGHGGVLLLRDGGFTVTMRPAGGSGALVLGAAGDDGDIYIRNTSGQTSISLDGASGTIRAGGGGTDGEVYLRNTSGQTVISLDGGDGNIIAGGFGQDGDLLLRDSAGVTTISLDGQTGNIVAGANGKDGDLLLRDGEGRTVIGMEGETGHIRCGNHGKSGVIFLQDRTGNSIVTISAASGNIVAGGNGVDGDVVLRRSNGQDAITLDADGGNIWLGGNGVDGDLVLFAASATTHSDASRASIHLNGDTGDIILRNADCAEEFTVACSDAALPGTVMVLGKDGMLEPSTRAYDKTAVGVVSGAGDYRPGIVLDRRTELADRRPIALGGKVFCKVTAAGGPIEPGDLLTPSDVPGHAMRAADPARAFGAVIGKALAPHEAGLGLIPMLIALQ